MTSKTSFDNIRAWLSEIREYAHDDVVIILLGIYIYAYSMLKTIYNNNKSILNNFFCLYLIGNKADCGSDRVVRKEDGERLAHDNGVPFMETSAKTGLNVELAFFAVARYITIHNLLY